MGHIKLERRYGPPAASGLRRKALPCEEVSSQSLGAGPDVGCRVQVTLGGFKVIVARVYEAGAKEGKYVAGVKHSSMYMACVRKLSTVTDSPLC